MRRRAHPRRCRCRPCFLKRERERVYLASWRARRAGVEDTLTLEQWLAIVERHRRRCSYCPRPFDVMDHVKGLAAGNTAENVTPACRACNTLKGSGAMVQRKSGTPRQRRLFALRRRFNAWAAKRGAKLDAEGLHAYGRWMLEQGYRPLTVYQQLGELGALGGVDASRLEGFRARLRAIAE